MFQFYRKLRSIHVYKNEPKYLFRSTSFLVSFACGIYDFFLMWFGFKMSILTTQPVELKKVYPFICISYSAHLRFLRWWPGLFYKVFWIGIEGLWLLMMAGQRTTPWFCTVKTSNKKTRKGHIKIGWTIFWKCFPYDTSVLSFWRKTWRWNLCSVKPFSK